MLVLAAVTHDCVAQKSDDESELFSLSLRELLDIPISSATKRPESPTNIPASVTVVTRREIAMFGYQSLDELLRNTPGVYLTDSTRDINIGLRGINNGGFQFLLNGVPQHPLATKRVSKSERARLNIPLEAIDRIEVIRGPMSVIYGNNAFQGAINIITNDIAESHSRVSVGGGNRNAQKLFARYAHEFEQGQVTLNLGQSATAGFTGAYSDMMSESQLAQLHNDMHASMAGELERDFKNIDASLTYHKLTANVRYSEIDYGIYAFSPSFADGNQALLKTYQFSLQYDTPINDLWAVRLSGIYSRESEEVKNPDFIIPTLHTLDNYQKQQDARSELEINTLFDNQMNLDGVLGFRHRVVNDVKNNAHIPIIGSDTQGWNQASLLQDAFFQMGYTLNESWRFVAGNRWTWAREYTVNVMNLLNQTNSSVVINQGGKTYSVPNVAAIYSLSDEHKFKLLYGMALQNHHSELFSEPERNNTLELNYLGLIGPATVNVSLYQSETDRIYRTAHRLNESTGIYEGQQDNSSQRTSKGIEFQLNYSPISNLDMMISGAWQNTSDNSNKSIQVGESPEYLLKGQVSYSLNAMSFGGGFYYVDSMNADYRFVNSAEQGDFIYIGDEVPSALSFNVNLHFQPSSSGYFFSLHVENVFDEEIRNPANEFVDLQRGLIMPGRQWVVTAGWQF